MSTYIASYTIDTVDRNVYSLIDFAIWDTLDDIRGESVDSGVWYIESKDTAKTINDKLVNVFNQKKVELSNSGIKDSILQKTKISICIHEFSKSNWISYNDNEASTWFGEHNIGKPENIISDPPLEMA